MIKRVSRRAFLTASATGLSVLACRPPSLTSIRTPEPGESSTPRPAPTALRVIPTITPAARLAVVPADGYVAVAPRVLRAGQTEAVSLALFRGTQSTTDRVTVALAKGGTEVARAAGVVAGHGQLALNLPQLAEGDYDLRIEAGPLKDGTTVRVEDGTLCFVETDKPIYKPGQTMHIRLLTLDPSLKPAPGDATIEVMDATGTKVFRKNLAADAYGMATVDLPLSIEPNLGTWKVLATRGKRSSQRDVRVERYVLPKYEVKIDLAKEWALANEPIKGTVTAEYSFGKPVAGTVEIKAARYVGDWEEYARLTPSIDGKVTFEVPAARYAAGSPAAGGLSQIRLEVTVREQATGYAETSDVLVTLANSPISLRVVPESTSFKPGLPFTLLAITETPDHQPIDSPVTLTLAYLDSKLAQIHRESRTITTRGGLASVQFTAPANAARLNLASNTPNGPSGYLALGAGYSPTGSFIHIQQTSRGALKVGDTAYFKIRATREARNFYYEVLARGTVVFSDFVSGDEIALTLSPAMAPECRLLVYQILANAEVAADYLPIKVSGDYPHQVTVSPARSEAKPGDNLAVAVQTEGTARVGLAAVDRSVFILAENRLNLQQVFDELERLFVKPQIELHEGEPIGGPEDGPIEIQPMAPRGDAPKIAPPIVGSNRASALMATFGAREIFADAGVVILSNRQVPAGQSLVPPHAPMLALGGAVREAAAPMPVASQALGEGDARKGPAEADDAAQLAEVQRVRQFFPETWVWADLTTDAKGQATHAVTVPDSITTWMFRAIAISPEKGLGIGEAQLRAFQPFFVSVDLPYAAIRGEEFPVNLALYNYQSTAQDFVVDLDAGDWFDLLDPGSTTVTVGPNAVGAARFKIRPQRLGLQQLKVTARSKATADAIIKDLLIEPEGVPREEVDNFVLTIGAPRPVDQAAPPAVVPGSVRRSLALSGNILTQSIEGLDNLLQMPYGCGEQNMILFAPDVLISRYLKETGQLKPEVMAKAEKLMLTGYQRELTYRRGDGSFSAFGAQDQEGSLWLTAFVLKTFAQARDLIYVDDDVLTTARDWIGQHQKADGSFDPVGFVHHEELLGGLNGTDALTALVGIALHEAGETAAVAKATDYLEGRLGKISDAYGLATTTYLLALAQSPRVADACDALMALARQSDDGLSWGTEDPGPVAAPQPSNGRDGQGIVAPRGSAPGPNRSAAIETTGYAALALLRLKDPMTAGKAIRWLAGRRNAFGGFGSTQDTVIALQAMTESARAGRSEVDLTVAIEGSSGFRTEVRINQENSDVLQVLDLPTDGGVTLTARGKGQAMSQAVLRYNLPAATDRAVSAFQLEVRYSAAQVEVNDRVTVTATVKYTPPEPILAAMSVLDIAVPTGFEPVTDTLDAVIRGEPRLKRYDLAGRKVVFYLTDLRPNDQLTIPFQIQALYPVKAQPVTSKAYAYYRPEWRGENLAGKMVVSG